MQLTAQSTAGGRGTQADKNKTQKAGEAARKKNRRPLHSVLCWVAAFRLLSSLFTADTFKEVSLRTEFDRLKARQTLTLC